MTLLKQIQLQGVKQFFKKEKILEPELLEE
jgi:hypothetical protein